MGDKAKRWIKVKGGYDKKDITGLIQSVKRHFSVLPSDEGWDDEQYVSYDDDSDVMAHAFNMGLAMYVLGFVDSKVDGTLRVLENVE